MANEVMGWAIWMPPFASSLTGVIENILGRVQEAFLLHIHQTLGESISGKHVMNQDLALLMSLESDVDIFEGTKSQISFQTVKFLFRSDAFCDGGPWRIDRSRRMSFALFGRIHGKRNCREGSAFRYFQRTAHSNRRINGKARTFLAIGEPRSHER